MTGPTPKRRWFRPTPGWLILALLVLECLLWLSERFQWFGFNQHKGWTVLIGVGVVGATILFMLLWFVVSVLFRWRFQFSIRSLLVLVVVVAIPCSWLAAEMKRAREQREAVAEIEKLNGAVEYDLPQYFDSLPPPPPPQRPPEPAWLLKLLGGDFFGDVVFVGYADEAADADLVQLKEFKHLQSLYLGGTKVTDAGLAHITGLTQLQKLSLQNTKVTDVGRGKLHEALPTCLLYGSFSGRIP